MCVKYKVTGCVYTTPPSLCITSDLVQALSGNVIVLIDPFSIAFKVDLGGR